MHRVSRNRLISLAGHCQVPAYAEEGLTVAIPGLGVYV